MSSDEITPNDAIELSDEELDDLSGGVNLQLVVARFHKSKIGFTQNPSLESGCGSASRLEAETTDTSLIQLSVTDATTDDLKVLSELFGDASAIEGSD